jgi:hypothetical protein
VRNRSLHGRNRKLAARGARTGRVINELVDQKALISSSIKEEERRKAKRR